MIWGRARFVFPPHHAKTAPFDFAQGRLDGPGFDPDLTARLNCTSDRFNCYTAAQ